ncbi:complex III assembly factor LYRM7 isoform X1 [Schistocerca cancellata]|uniref:complex III assembly factor LYRM7 isoform X1 n=1 Tax=Schistocerca cancellata TaxID=274614 RepID=UPI002117A4DF|nr:complex III assembly factor LYRM7 isoform X1 [Schistocerca cancellata]
MPPVYQYSKLLGHLFPPCQVLKSFKTLHQARKRVFQGDEVALNAARTKINEEYRKNKHVTDVSAVQELVKLAHDVAKELRASVVQARKIKDDMFELRITEETYKLDNIPGMPFQRCKS